MQPTFTVSIFGPYPALSPLAEYELSNVTAASVTEQLPGGFDRLSLTFDAPIDDVRAFIPPPVALRDGSHIVVRGGASIPFEGVITSMTLSTLEAVGYGTFALQYGSIGTGGDAQVTSGVMVRHALAQAPWLVPVNIADPGVMHAWSEVQDRAPGDAIRQFCTEGGEASDGNQYEWLFVVGPNRLTRFVPMMRPTTPDYALSYDPRTMALSWEADVWDAVSIVYQDNSVRQTAGPYYRPGFDRTSRYVRHKVLTGGDQGASGAVAFALTQLALHSSAQLSGTLTFTNWDGIGMHVAESVRIPGLTENDDTAVAFITSANHDLLSGESQLTLGTPTNTPLAFLRRLADSDAALRRNMTPVNWSRSA
jgi:hypothetical protein